MSSMRPPKNAATTNANMDSASVAYIGQSYVKRKGTKVVLGARVRSKATVHVGIAARNAAAKRAPRICKIVRRLRTVGTSTIHATAVPHGHHKRRARSNPLSVFVSGKVMRIHGRK